MSNGDSGGTYLEMDRAAWAALRGDLVLPLREEDLAALRGVNSPISLEEALDVYLPLAGLLTLRLRRAREELEATARFLGQPMPGHSTFIVGVAGSVSVGKSTTARLLAALLQRLAGGQKVDLVTTDGFLHPNRVLEERGLMRRKGFPESYDVKALMRFVTDVRLGRPSVACPVYNHVVYDVVEGAQQVVDRPAVLILEGLNVLQTGTGTRRSRRLLSDLLDFTLYVDAPTAHLAAWYEHRFLMLRDTAFQDPQSHFHRYAALSDDEARELARSIWKDINEANLVRNILPTRERAHVILEKAVDHRVSKVRVRRY